MKKSGKSFVIIGSGITGNTLAISLKKFGHNVTVYDKGINPKLLVQGQGKSINLALSNRGLEYLSEIEIKVPPMVPMSSRVIHSEQGSLKLPNDQFGRFTHSVNRNILNASLYEQAAELGVIYHFQSELKDINFDNRTITIIKDADTIVREYDFLIGSDGSNSRVAECIENNWGVDDQKPVKLSPWVYQEYEIKPKKTDNEDKFRLSDAESFHIWPGKKQFLIAMPNDDRSFTVTLFCSDQKAQELKNVKEEGDLEAITNIFKSCSGDTSVELFNIEENFSTNNVSHIYVRDSLYWHEKTKAPRVLLIGDSGHAFPPFLGLGCNACIEDISVFMDGLKKLPEQGIVSISKLILDFTEKRRLDTDALRDASVDNAKVLSEDTAVSDLNNLKVILSIYLEKEYLQLFVEPFVMYTFTHMTESEARFRQLHQDTLLNMVVNLPGIQEYFKDCPIDGMMNRLLNLLKMKDNELAITFKKIVKTLMAVYIDAHKMWHQQNDSKTVVSPFYKNKYCVFDKLKLQKDNVEEGRSENENHM